MSATDWHPQHDEPLLILAMDHRDSFGKTLFDVVDDQPTDPQVAAMRRGKMLIYRGLLSASALLPAGRAGVLVDEQYGEDVIVRATTDPVVLAIPLEASGHDWFTLQWGDQWLEHVQHVAPDYAKVLVRDNPNFDAGERSRQLDGLAAVSQGLTELGIPLLYELLVPATKAQLTTVDDDSMRYDTELRPDLTTKVIADNQAAGVEPALWKIEGLETVEAARAVATAARAGGRSTELIVLGRDAPAERVSHWLSVASQVSEFVGFAIGRSIWQDTIRAWHAGELDDAHAVTEIERKYLDFAGQWRSAVARNS